MQCLCFAQDSNKLAVSGASGRAELRQYANEINAISRYCQTVDHIQRSSEPLTFFSFNGEWERWTGHKKLGADNLASVWMKSGKVVSARIWSEAAAKNGIEATQYCFREDGSLAQVRVLPSVRSTGKPGLRTEVTVGRSAMYSADGKKILTSEANFDPHMLKSERTAFKYLDPPVIYKSADALPFINLIRNVL